MLVLKKYTPVHMALSKEELDIHFMNVVVHINLKVQVLGIRFNASSIVNY